MAGAQAARVGGGLESGGVIVGRACVDLDGDGRCGPGDPGVAGARVRVADGHMATADEEGRFHLFGLAGRLLLPDREAYGAAGVAMDGAAVRRAVEQAPGGAVAVDLVVAPPRPTAESACTIDRTPLGTPTLGEGGVAWPVSGVVAPGARLLVDGRSAAVGPDGKFEGQARLVAGPNTVAVLVLAPDGAAELHALPVHLARPGGAATRFYPGPPRLLATLQPSRGPTGALVIGIAAPGVVVRVGGARPSLAADGTFGAFAPLQPEDEAVSLEVTAADGARLALALPLPPPEQAFEGLFLGDLELSVGADGVRGAGRGTGTVTGTWRGIRLDAGLDLDDRDDGVASLARPRDSLAAAHAPDPSRTFLIAGDASSPGDANAGRGRVWATVEADGLSLAAGWTRAGLPGEGLGRYDRALFGVRVDGEGKTGPVRLFGGVFGAATGDDDAGVPPPRAVHQVLLATGGSLFYLSGTGVVVGSLAVRAEWRDPSTGLLTGARALRRGVDYRLDEGSGRLLLLRPLASVAPPAVRVTGDPFAASEARLVVDYLDAGLPGAARRAGGRAGVEVGPLRLEVRGAAEDGERETWRLGAAAAALDLGSALRAGVEVARTEGRLYEAGSGFTSSGDGGFSSFADAPDGGGATAVHAEVRGEAGGVGWRGWWRERPAGYSDGTWLESRTALERGAEVKGEAGPVQLLLAVAERAGTDQRDPTGRTPVDARRAVARAAAPLGPVELTAELFHEQLGQPAPGEQAAAGLRGAWHAADGLVLEASHTQAFARSGEVTSATFTAAGVSLGSKDGTLAVRGGWGPALGPRLVLSGAKHDRAGAVYGSVGADPAAAGRGGALGSVLGASAGAGWLEVFTEEAVAEDRLGLRAGRVVGVAASPTPGLRLALSAERGERLLAGGERRARASAGGSATWVAGPIRLSGHGEVISEGGQERWVTAASAAWSPSASLELTLRALGARGGVDGRQAEDLDVTGGVAWRGAPWSLLATVARVLEARPAALRREGWIAGLATTGAVGGRLRAGLGAHLAVQRVGGVADDRVSGSLRVEVRVFGPLDVAAEYARRAALGQRVLGDLDALRAEVGAGLGPVRLALGYVLVGYAGDGVTPDDTSGRAFLRATLVL